MGRALRVVDAAGAPAATALLLLALPAPASATIVVQRGIAGANVNMSQPQVRAKLGPPDTVRHPKSPIFGAYTSWLYGKTRVDMFRGGDRKVFNVTTTSRAQRTAAGVGVGSTERAVRKGVRRIRCATEFGGRHCFVGNFEPGRKVTDFSLSTKGRVTRVTIGYVID